MHKKSKEKLILYTLFVLMCNHYNSHKMPTSENAINSGKKESLKRRKMQNGKRFRAPRKVL